MENKKFEIPELIIISFDKEDIITESGPGARFGVNGDEWNPDEI